MQDGWMMSVSCNVTKLQTTPQAITAEEIEKVLSHVKMGTALGYDNIHPEFLKQMPDLDGRVSHVSGLELRIQKVW